VDTTQVRPQSDGLHVVMDASGDVANAEIDTGSTPVTFSGVGVDPQEDGSRGIPIAPGPWFVGCSAHGDAVPIDAFGTSRAPTFEIVDPAGIYVPTDLACDSPSTGTYSVTGSDIAADSIAAVPGILPTDSVQAAGYPDGPGSTAGQIMSVLRGGAPVARITIPYETGTAWTISVDTCPGSGIGVLAESDQAPDVVKVRCTAAGTQVEAPAVAAQPDGVHILVVSNETNADEVLMRPASGAPWLGTYSSGSNGLDREFVYPLYPGAWQFRCSAGDAPVSGMPGAAWDGAAHLTVFDVARVFVPYGLSCSADQRATFGSAPQQGPLPAPSNIEAHLAGLLATDVVERAGYLSADAGGREWWRVVRDGRVVASLYVTNFREGLVVLMAFQCDTAGLQLVD
jgi:hypothetical protein